MAAGGRHEGPACDLAVMTFRLFQDRWNSGNRKAVHIRAAASPCPRRYFSYSTRSRAIRLPCKSSLPMHLTEALCSDKKAAPSQPAFVSFEVCQRGPASHGRHPHAVAYIEKPSGKPPLSDIVGQIA